ncbi:MAG: glycosyltransferase family 4 protein [Nitrospinae bacterium]|nr:glycosyltransferase family 4 protein [Nitrospinota bacterium]
MPKNVLYVHGIGEIGGAEKDLLSYLCLLDRTEFLPHVVCPGSGTLIEEVKRLHVPVMALQLPPWRKLKNRFQVPWAVWKLVKIFRQWNIDIVHVNDYWWAPVAYLAAKICRIPVIVHIRAQIEPVRIKQYWLDKPDYLCPVSKDIENVVLSMAVTPSHVHVTYSGIDLDRFCHTEDQREIRRRYGLKDGQPIIGTVANLFPHKGYEYLLEALVEIKDAMPDICCFIVGKGSEAYQQKLFQLIEKRQLMANVVFAGFQKNVHEFINVFDVFVLPSLMEGFGIALLEAMAMSKPIVACRVGGIPEVIIDGVTGILVPPKDSNALAKALVGLLPDEQAKRRFGEAARKVVEERFSQEIAMKRIENLYRDLTGL